MILAATSGHTYWWIALAIGLVAALIVAGLLALLVQSVVRIDRSVSGLLDIAGRSAPTPPTFRSSSQRRRCLR